MTKNDNTKLKMVKNLLSGIVTRFDLVEKYDVSFDDTDIPLPAEDIEQLRIALAIINNVVVRENSHTYERVNEEIREHPERYSVEFLKQTGFSVEEIKHLMQIRSERLKK